MARFELRPLAPQEALAHFDAKGYAPATQRFDYRDLWLSEHDRAFTVAKAMRDDVLETIRAHVRKALAEGRTLDQFQRSLAPELQRLGWWGRDSMQDPVTGEVKSVQLGSERRLKVIYDANLRSALAAGRWARIQRSKVAFPYLRYIQIDRPSKRHDHARYHGLVLPVDHPAWRRIFPPNGWFCGCSTEPLTAAQVEERGYEVAEDFELEEENWTNPRTGEIERVPLGVDPAWAARPGLAEAPPPEPGYGPIRDPEALFNIEGQSEALGLVPYTENPAFSLEEKRLIQTWQGSTGFAVNEALRAGRADPMAEALIALIGRTEIQPGLLLHRGVRDLALEVGDVYEDAGFQSFSLSAATAAEFALTQDPREPGVILRFLTRSGDRAIHLSAAEDEILLAPGRWRVTAMQETAYHDYKGVRRRARIYDLELEERS